MNNQGRSGTILLTWFNFNPSMDKWLHPISTVAKIIIYSQTSTVAPLAAK